MEIFNNTDNSVTKYLHDDGSETCIKVVPSAKLNFNELTGGLEMLKKEKQKYSVIISHSSGCPIGCKMCYLTIKKYPYHPIKYYDITNNVIQAIQAKVEDNPSLKSKYIKLCWMGMGDAFLDLTKVRVVTTQILTYVFRNNLALGLDGVDVGTVWPKKVKNLTELNILNQRLKKYDSNPYNTKDRSPLRIFYSLHRPDSGKDTYLIPNSAVLSSIEHKLRDLKDLCGIDVIFHQLFIEGETDFPWVITELKTMFNYFFKGFELRILRYNECKDSPYKESPKFNTIIRELDGSVDKLKYQVSPGSEIKAACGQFIMKKMKEVK